MQLKVLLIKDVTAMFKQKAVLATLIIPMFLMIAFGLLPTLVGIDDPTEIAYFNEDEGIEGINLGNNVTEFLTYYEENDKSVKFKHIESADKFFDNENAIWIPSNFTQVANETHEARYYLKYSDSDIRVEPVMVQTIPAIIDAVISQEILKPIVVPSVIPERLFEPGITVDEEETEAKTQIAFPLAYMSFLILILSGSAIRITGFNAEKNAGMMELLLASVKYRRELILSKLLTGLIYGLATVLSYITGVLIALVLNSESDDNEFSNIFFSSKIFTVQNLILIGFLFSILIFMGMEFMLTSQIMFGKEAGDRIGPTMNTVFGFLFYFSLIADPLSEGTLQRVNPFFWPFRLSLNLMFNEFTINSLVYLLSILFVILLMLKLMTTFIQKEKMIFDK